jgi:hypothetical protein
MAQFSYPQTKTALLDAYNAHPDDFHTLVIHVSKEAEIPICDIYDILKDSNDSEFAYMLEAGFLHQIDKKSDMKKEYRLRTIKSTAATHEKKTISFMKTALKSAGISKTSGLGVLDIGADSARRLGTVSVVFGTSSVVGLNTSFSFEDTRMRLFDGVNIPRDVTGIDIILLNDVLQHIPSANLGTFICGLKGRAKYIIVKDVDLYDRHISAMGLFHNYFHAEILLKEEKRKHININIRLSTVDRLFATIGLERYATKTMAGFSKTYYAVYKKK